ncbi:hypothetical protein Tco_0433863, partial [Tanacetum coccineum]
SSGQSPSIPISLIVVLVVAVVVSVISLVVVVVIVVVVVVVVLPLSLVRASHVNILESFTLKFHSSTVTPPKRVAAE